MKKEDEEAIDILLETRSDELSEWETNFLRNIYERDSLTDNQQEKLDEIWNRYMDLNR